MSKRLEIVLVVIVLHTINFLIRTATVQIGIASLVILCCDQIMMVHLLLVFIKGSRCIHYCIVLANA